MWLENLGRALAEAAAFSVVGILLFLVAFVIMRKMSPFSLRKEIEEDQNTALAILMGSVILGIALIVAAAVHA
jgi:uncharacterized membrane protein YjfL (UPF0719 family)